MSGAIPLYPLYVFMAWKVTALAFGQISMRKTTHHWLRANILYQQPEDTLRHREGESTLILGKFQVLSCYLLGIMKNYSIENYTANGESSHSTFFLSFPSNTVVLVPAGFGIAQSVY
jgi:hypothetical protein